MTYGQLLAGCLRTGTPEGLCYCWHHDTVMALSQAPVQSMRLAGALVVLSGLLVYGLNDTCNAIGKHCWKTPFSTAASVYTYSTRYWSMPFWILLHGRYTKNCSHAQALANCKVHDMSMAANVR